MPATFGPQMPAQQTTMSAGISPWSVTTPVTRSSSAAGCPGPRAGPASARRARVARLDLRLDGAHRLGQAVGGHVQAAEHPVAVEQGVQLDAFVGVDQLGLDAPGGEPAVPAVQLGEPLGGGGHLEAADLEEAGLAVDVEASRTSRRCSGPSRSWSWRRWSGRPGPGACERGARRWRAAAPWSTTVMSSQPRAESSSARAAPTTPAPMMTTRGPAIAAPPVQKPVPPVQLLSAQHASGCATQCACRTGGCQGGRRRRKTGRNTAMPGGRRASRAQRPPGRSDRLVTSGVT